MPGKEGHCSGDDMPSIPKEPIDQFVTGPMSAEAVTFRTKPTLALEMIERALDAGGPCRWVIGDEVYGGDRTLRFRLEQRGQPFVGAVTCNEPLWWDGRSIGRPRSLPLSGRPGRGSPWGGYN